MQLFLLALNLLFFFNQSYVIGNPAQVPAFEPFQTISRVSRPLRNISTHMITKCMTWKSAVKSNTKDQQRYTPRRNVSYFPRCHPKASPAKSGFHFFNNFKRERS